MKDKNTFDVLESLRIKIEDKSGVKLDDKDLSNLTGYAKSSVSSWKSGTRGIPDPAINALEYLEGNTKNKQMEFILKKCQKQG
ncbi:MAG: hypothetical protein CMH98_11165 [Oceanospirillaceae bacterium]|nr:hypothetical protein [Oceanospirillaceae bacterium]